MDYGSPKSSEFPNPRPHGVPKSGGVPKSRHRIPKSGGVPKSRRSMSSQTQGSSQIQEFPNPRRAPESGRVPESRPSSRIQGELPNLASFPHSPHDQISWNSWNYFADFPAKFWRKPRPNSIPELLWHRTYATMVSTITEQTEMYGPRWARQKC